MACTNRYCRLCVDCGECFAVEANYPTGVPVSEELSTDARTDSERRGITIGILIVALLCLSLFFIWHHYGIAGSGGRAAAETTRSSRVRFLCGGEVIRDSGKTSAVTCADRSRRG